MDTIFKRLKKLFKICNCFPRFPNSKYCTNWGEYKYNNGIQFATIDYTSYTTSLIILQVYTKYELRGCQPHIPYFYQRHWVPCVKVTSTFKFPYFYTLTITVHTSLEAGFGAKEKTEETEHTPWIVKVCRLQK